MNVIPAVLVIILTTCPNFFGTTKELIKTEFNSIEECEQAKTEVHIVDSGWVCGKITDAFCVPGKMIDKE